MICGSRHLEADDSELHNPVLQADTQPFLILAHRILVLGECPVPATA